MPNPTSSKRRIGRCNLLKRQFGDTQCNRRHCRNVAFDAHRMGKVYNTLNAVILDQLGRHRVHRIGQSVLQRDHFAILHITVVRAPRVLAFRHVNAGLLVGQLSARVQSQPHCSGVYEGLKGGPHLAPRLAHIVKLRPLVIQISDPSFDLSIVGVNAHQAGMQEGLLMANAVHRGHQGVHPTADAHHASLGLFLELGIQLAAGHDRPNVTTPALFWPTEMNALICTVPFGDVKSWARALWTLLAHGQAIPAALHQCPVQDAVLFFGQNVLREKRPSRNLAAVRPGCAGSPLPRRSAGGGCPRSYG